MTPSADPPGSRPPPSEGTQQELEFTPVELADEHSAPRAYVASALTHLNDEEREEVEGRCDQIEQHLKAEFGILAHVPKNHTSPHGHRELDPTEVNRIDQTEVVGADVLVYLADRPADGAGKEVAWAERNGSSVIVLSPIDPRPSRLLAGSTSDITEEIFTDNHSMLGALHKGVSERLPRIDGHREWRQARASLDGYRRGLTAPTTTQTGGLTRRRAEEILSSNDHLDNAALGELRQLDPALDAYLTGRPAPDTTAASPTPAALNDRQLDALDNAALLHEWPASQVARKVAAFISLHAADSSPLTTDRRQELRASFTDIEDWEALDV